MSPVVAALAVLALLLSPQRGHAQPSRSNSLAEQMEASGADKHRFKAYLRARLHRIEDQHKARMDFLSKEADAAEDFWKQMRDEREVFEKRLVDETESFFESLGSLDASGHAAAVADFQKLQDNEVGAFEAAQKKKRDDFFAGRAKRWAEFAAREQKQADDSAADSLADWRSTGPQPAEAAPAGEAPAAVAQAALAQPAAPAEPPAEPPQAKPKPKAKPKARSALPRPRRERAEVRREELEPPSQTKSEDYGTEVTGRVTSSEEGPMEGVLVTVQRGDDPITTTVVTNSQGIYAFPRGRLEPGHYTLQIRAATYDLKDPVDFELARGQTVSKDLGLIKLKYYSDQMTSADWILSVPGMEKQVRVTRACVSCHTLERVVKADFTAKKFESTIWRMEGVYDYTSSDDKPVPIPPGTTLAQLPDPDYLRRTAEFLTSVELNGAEDFKFPLRMEPRPKGPATHVVITEYTLPREGAVPVDLAMDKDGYVWYADLQSPIVGRLDPRTAKTQEWQLPVFRKGFNAGSYYMQMTPDGKLWFARYRQNGITEFDPVTHKMRSFSARPELSNDSSRCKMVDASKSYVDDKVWFDSASTAPYIARADLRTGNVEMFDPFHPKTRTSHDRTVRKWELEASAGSHFIYGIAADSQNNAYATDMYDSSIVRIDAKTGEADWYYLPTPNSAPRRAIMDKNDDLWFSEWGANKITRFDTKTKKFTEWTIPMPYSNPWMVVPDKNGEIWGAGRHNDRVTRLDPKTGRFIQYLLPFHRQVQGSFVENGPGPVTYWGASAQMHTIFKIEQVE